MAHWATSTWLVVLKSVSEGKPTSIWPNRGTSCATPHLYRLDADDLKDVQAEVIAIQAVLIAVFRRMGSRYPELSELFKDAFGEAETIMSGVAVRTGMEPVLGTTTAALTVIEELREAVSSGKPKS
jgi:hypothetical protein